MILILSAPDDVHATSVLAELQAKGAAAELIDLSHFPTRARLTMAFAGGQPAACDRDALHWPGGAAIDLGGVGAVWYRRPQPFMIAAEVRDGDVRNFAYQECTEAMEGLWRSLACAWLNEPLRDEAASRKPYQLRVAQRVGLRIPETLITNDPDAAQEFALQRGGRVVYKSFSATERHWRETRLLRQDELPRLAAVRHAPVIFQEFVAATADIRVTVVGDAMFAAAIAPAPGAYAVDFRMNLGSARIAAIDLPPAVQQRLHALMRQLGIAYGAIDLRHTPEGEFVFLEVNPAGQWLFIEDATRQPITAAVAAWLRAADSHEGAGRAAVERAVVLG